MDKDIGETPKEHRFCCSLACNLPRRVASGQTISSLRPGQKKTTKKQNKTNPKKQTNKKPQTPSFSYFQTLSLFILYCYAADSISNV